jgi:hypothetical protein
MAVTLPRVPALSSGSDRFATPISNSMAMRETVAGGSADFGIPLWDGQEENDSHTTRWTSQEADG